jgi:hypothetical protein
MTQRGHIQRFYRQRFAELHTRKLRVNSHRKQMGDWRLRWSYDPRDCIENYEWWLNGVRVSSFSRNLAVQSAAVFPSTETLSPIFATKHDNQH